MKKIAIGAIALGFGVTSFGQSMHIGDFSTGYSQDFNDLGTTTITNLTSNALIPNSLVYSHPEWVYANSGTNTTTITAGTGSGTGGGLYNFGSASSTDRAFGSLASGNAAAGDFHIGMRATNTTGASTGLYVIQFDLEQWRLGAANKSPQDTIKLSYKLYDTGTYSTADLRAGTGFVTGGITWQTTTDNFATMSAPTVGSAISLPTNTGSIGALDGNLAANKVQVRAVVQLFTQGLSWDNHEELIFRFSDTDDSGSDHAYGIDNVKVVPEPASMAAIGLGIFGLISKRRRKA